MGILLAGAEKKRILTWFLGGASAPKKPLYYISIHLPQYQMIVYKAIEKTGFTQIFKFQQFQSSNLFVPGGPRMMLQQVLSCCP